MLWSIGTRARGGVLERARRGVLERARGGALDMFISARALGILKRMYQCARGVLERAHKQFIRAHARNMLTL